MYKAEYEDENFEIIYANSDTEAMREAEDYEKIHRIVFNLFELDEYCNKIRMIYWLPLYPYHSGAWRYYKNADNAVTWRNFNAVFSILRRFCVRTQKNIKLPKIKMWAN